MVRKVGTLPYIVCAHVRDIIALSYTRLHHSLAPESHDPLHVHLSPTLPYFCAPMPTATGDSQGA